MEKFQLEVFLILMNIGSASGLVYTEDKLFLIQDNSTYLYQYNFSSKNVTLIELVAEAAKSIDKKSKPDFESITLVKNQLQLFGSGSGSETSNCNMTVYKKSLTFLRKITT